MHLSAGCQHHVAVRVVGWCGEERSGQWPNYVWPAGITQGHGVIGEPMPGTDDGGVTVNGPKLHHVRRVRMQWGRGPVKPDGGPAASRRRRVQAARAARWAGHARWQCERATAARLTGGGAKGQEDAVSASPAASTESSASLWRLEIAARPELSDALASATATRLKAVLGLSPASLRTRKLYHLDLGLDAGEAAQVLAALVDPVSEVGALGCLPDPSDALLLSVGFRPGVTDSVGRSVQRAAEDRLGRTLAGQVYTSTMYVFTGLTQAQVEAAARELHNPLIQRVRIEACPAGAPPREAALDVPHAGTSTVPGVLTVALGAADDAMLEQISRAGMLALSLPEMQAIRDHFRSIGRDPSDAELECIAQTWSEHCKHKIFAAPITYTALTSLRWSSADSGSSRRCASPTVKATLTVMPGCRPVSCAGNSTRTRKLWVCGSAFGYTTTSFASSRAPVAGSRITAACRCSRIAATSLCGTCTSTRSSPSEMPDTSGCPGRTVSPTCTWRLVRIPE